MNSPEQIQVMSEYSKLSKKKMLKDEWNHLPIPKS